jgi:hypothetical protein
LFSKGVKRVAFAFAAFAAAAVANAPRAEAIPLFAQRYHLDCTACHSVLPELNAFGNYFRNHGYRIPKAPRHGTTGVALRYQMEWEKDPPSGQRRWSPGGVLLSNADIGAITAFLHYNLGAGGGPSAVYLGYLTTYNEHTQSTYRAGYYELPLVQSPGQRLDDLAPYGYDQTRVGLNNLVLAAPRIGMEAERQVGSARIAATIAFGEYDGAAYGGKPIATGEATYAGRPEVGLFVTMPATKGVDVFANGIVGQRSIGVVGQPVFADQYQRYGIGADAHRGKFELTAQQWFGYDGDADGVGDAIASNGGFVRLKFYPNPHAYLAVRYDAVSNPFITRDVVYYIGTQVTHHARVVIQNVHTFGIGKDALGGALTIGFPWPLKL